MGTGKTTHEISPSVELTLADGTLISATNPMPSQLYVDDKDSPGTRIAVSGKSTGSGTKVPYFILADETGNPSQLLLTQADGLADTANGLYASALNYLYNGATWDRIRGDIANGVDVDVTRSALPSGAATSANQTTLIGRFVAAAALSDAQANPTTTRVGAVLQAFNGSTWDRLRSAGDNADAVATSTLGRLIVNAKNQMFNGSTWDRIRGDTTYGQDVDVTRIAAGTNVIGYTSDTAAYIDESGNSLTVKRAVINTATSGDNTLVAAVVGKKIRVLNVMLIARGTVLARFESGASGTALTGQMQLYSGTGFAPGYDKHGHFETGTNTLLNLELSAAVNVDGWLTYVEV